MYYRNRPSYGCRLRMEVRLSSCVCNDFIHFLNHLQEISPTEVSYAYFCQLYGKQCIPLRNISCFTDSDLCSQRHTWVALPKSWYPSLIRQPIRSRYPCMALCKDSFSYQKVIDTGLRVPASLLIIMLSYNDIPKAVVISQALISCLGYSLCIRSELPGVCVIYSSRGLSHVGICFFVLRLAR